MSGVQELHLSKSNQRLSRNNWKHEVILSWSCVRHEKNGTTQRPNFPCISRHFQGVVSQPRDTTRSALWKKHQLASKCCACHEKTYYTLRAVTKWRFWTTVKYCPRPYYTLGAVVKRKFCKILSFHIQRILLMFNLWKDCRYYTLPCGALFLVIYNIFRV